MNSKKTILSVPVSNSADTDSRIWDGGVCVSTEGPGSSAVESQRWPQKVASPDSDAYRDLLHDLATVIAPLQTLHQQAVEAHAPTVQKIFRNGSRDARLIKHTLDHLLDHACIPQGLALFKSLCRHYWQINPQATASYINAYREMWDSDDENEPEVQS
jgi:hypothetical protein